MNDPGVIVSAVCGLLIAIAHFFIFRAYCRLFSRRPVSGDDEAELKDGNFQKRGKGITLFQRIISFVALGRIAVTAFLLWLAISVCSMEAMPVGLGFLAGSGGALIYFIKVSAEVDG